MEFNLENTQENFINISIIQVKIALQWPYGQNMGINRVDHNSPQIQFKMDWRFKYEKWNKTSRRKDRKNILMIL